MEVSGIVTAVGWASIVALNIIMFVTSRRDRIAERLGQLEQRVARIEGILAHSNSSP